MIKIRILGCNVRVIFNETKDKYYDFIDYICNINGAYKEYGEEGWIIPKENLEDLKSKFKTEMIKKDYDYIGQDMKLEPYEYQKETIYYSYNNPQSLLVLPTGSGKTVIGIGFYLELLNNNYTNTPCIVCTKASLKFQWVQEIKKFSDLRAKEIKTLSANNNNKEKFEQQFEETDIFVLNYETLKNKEVCKYINKKKPDTIVVDEIHYIGNKNAAKSKALHKFNKLKYKIGLTATPITKNVQNLYSIFKLLNKDLFPLYGEFERKFLVLNRFGDVIRGKDDEYLKEVIKPFTFIKSEKEIGKQLPDLNVFKLECELTPQLLKATNIIFDYKDKLLQDKEQKCIKYKGKINEQELIKQDEEIKLIDNKLNESIIFLQQLADDPFLIETSTSKLKDLIKLTDKTSPKYNLLINKIEEILSINDKEKICIFTEFKRMQLELVKRLEKNLNLKCAIVNGSMDSKERYYQVYNLFQNNDEYNILIATDAMNEGVSLYKCKYLIEFDLAKSYAIQTQRHGRIRRANSVSRESFVYQLIAKDSWDENQLKSIQKKEKTDYVFFKEDKENE